MVRLIAVGALALLLAGCGGTGVEGAGPGGGASPAASCVAPFIDTQASVQPGGATPPEPPTVASGASATLYGHAYFADCYDTGQSGTPPPIESVDLVVELPGGKRTDLGTVKPDQNGAFSITLDVPDGTEAGTGRIFDGLGGRGHEFTVADD